jgi:hypothetical protein
MTLNQKGGSAMAKSKVASKTGPKQEQKKGNQPIKHFDSGVVSWSLFSDLYEIIFTFKGRLNFLCKSACCSGELDDFSVAMDLIENQLEQFEKTYKEFCQKAETEKGKAGGNDVSTIRDISLVRSETEEFVTKLQKFKEKAEKELEEIAG